MSSFVEQLQWRRNKILELTTRGHSQHDIARTLQVAVGTVNRDLAILRRQSTISVGELMIEKLETIDSYSTTQEAAKKKVR